MTGHVVLGSATDVDRAVVAAASAFASLQHSTRESIVLFDCIIAAYKAREADLAGAITSDIGQVCCRGGVSFEIRMSRVGARE